MIKNSARNASLLNNAPKPAFVITRFAAYGHERTSLSPASVATRPPRPVPSTAPDALSPADTIKFSLSSWCWASLAGRKVLNQSPRAPFCFTVY